MLLVVTIINFKIVSPVIGQVELPVHCQMGKHIGRLAHRIDHIGIEWDSVSGLSSCGSLTADADGRYISGNYFGWGIAHEIGHNINQGSYAFPEAYINAPANIRIYRIFRCWAGIRSVCGAEGSSLNPL